MSTEPQKPKEVVPPSGPPNIVIPPDGPPPTVVVPDKPAKPTKPEPTPEQRK